MTKKSLDRLSYIDAALDVVAEVGVEKLSMRKVASRLNVSPMAMYKHFPGKEQLLAATLDEFIARANVIAEDDMAWDEWVQEVGGRMYDALCNELSWVPLLGSLRLGAQGAAVTDAFVRKLCAANFSMEQSLNAYFAMIQIVLGAVCMRSSLQADTVAEGDISRFTRDYLEEVDAERLHIAPILEAVSRQNQIDIGLPLLIVALKAQLARNSH